MFLNGFWTNQNQPNKMASNSNSNCEDQSDIKNCNDKMNSENKQQQQQQQQQQPQNDPTIPDSFFGRYRLESSENFESFLKEIGIGYIFRKIACLASADLSFTKEPDGYVRMTAESSCKSIVNRFKINEIFDETRMDGKVCKSIIEFVPPNKFIQMQWDDKLEMKYIREFVGNKINTRSICGNVESFRVYKRID